MSKLVRSRIVPESIYPDVVRDGSVRLLCRWDIREIEVEDEMGTHTEYEYAEQVIWWALPYPEYLTRQGNRQVLTDAGRAYLASIENEILGWAMASYCPTEYTITFDMIRLKRNQLLAASDWTQIPDAPLTEEQKEAWRTYRQALRDIPQMYASVDDIVWPVPPS